MDPQTKTLVSTNQGRETRTSNQFKNADLTGRDPAKTDLLVRTVTDVNRLKNQNADQDEESKIRTVTNYFGLNS